MLWDLAAEDENLTMCRAGSLLYVWIEKNSRAASEFLHACEIGFEERK